MNKLWNMKNFAGTMRALGALQATTTLSTMVEGHEGFFEKRIWNAKSRFFTSLNYLSEEAKVDLSSIEERYNRLPLSTAWMEDAIIYLLNQDTINP